MCGHKQIGIWEVSKITVVDSNVVNYCHTFLRQIKLYLRDNFYSATTFARISLTFHPANTILHIYERENTMKKSFSTGVTSAYKTSTQCECV